MNPVTYSTFGADANVKLLFGNIGTVISGPIQLFLLGAGLYLALRVYRQLGMLGRLPPFDIALLGGAFLYAGVVIACVAALVRNNLSMVTVERALTWPGDYISGVLLLEAIFLRRSTAEMGWGYVSKVWGAFVAGIFLASFCNLLNLLTACGIFGWIQTSFVWYLWYPVSAAFALAPAYQWEAMRTAQARMAKEVDELELSTS